MRTIHRDCVVGIILSKDMKLLMGMKDPKGGGVYADCWHLPGGGIEQSETQLKALQREMLEETGIQLEGAAVHMIDDTGTGQSEKTLKDTGEVVLCKMRFYVYRINLGTNAKDTVTQPGDDLQEIQWFDLDTLMEQKLTPPSQAFFSTKMHLVHIPL
jgi:8-oxo-dGTP pyrophosphatase MutT (NUDIX family)